MLSDPKRFCASDRIRPDLTAICDARQTKRAREYAIVRHRRQEYAPLMEALRHGIQSGMLRNIPKQQDVSPMSPNSIALEAPLVASPNQAMRAIQVSRKKLYELINKGELESYTKGKSRRITIKSINEYIERRLAAEAARRGRAASDRNHQPGS